MKRGPIPRSSYVRALIESNLADGQPVIAHRLQFHEDDAENETKPMPKPSGRKFRVEPAKQDCYHTKGWKRGNIFDTCVECGETKPH